jgi:hypothetical protein
MYGANRPEAAQRVSVTSAAEDRPIEATMEWDSGFSNTIHFKPPGSSIRLFPKIEDFVGTLAVYRRG